MKTCAVFEGNLDWYTWFERDRQHVELRNKRTERTVWEAWDEQVSELVEDGFLNPKDLKGSATQYAISLGLVK